MIADRFVGRLVDVDGAIQIGRISELLHQHPSPGLQKRAVLAIAQQVLDHIPIAALDRERPDHRPGFCQEFVKGIELGVEAVGVSLRAVAEAGEHSLQHHPRGEVIVTCRGSPAGARFRHSPDVPDGYRAR